MSHSRKSISKEEFNQHMKEERANLRKYTVAGKKYNEALDRMSLLLEMKRRKMVK